MSGPLYFLAGYWTCWIVERAVRAWLASRKVPAPTLAQRRRTFADEEWRGPVGEKTGPVEEPEIAYQFMGVTGSEE